MDAVLVWLVRTIGIGGCAFLALYVYDWGIPGASRIPFLSSVPILGDLTTGRAHSYAADQVKLATTDMVTRFERDALQAQLDAERRNREIAQAASAHAQERADAAELARQSAATKLTDLEAQARKAGLDTWSEEELQWYEKH